MIVSLWVRPGRSESLGIAAVLFVRAPTLDIKCRSSKPYHSNINSAGFDHGGRIAGTAALTRVLPLRHRRDRGGGANVFADHQGRGSDRQDCRNLWGGE